ncbi:hypothetical protein C5L39_10310 [Corynebacterium alimapuense]|uniref:Uncharacterized protein n=1 Tax=Corynebacterium alimapuense TaxID=1576874 RepID=A0A3M8K563_9CORY|nr:hypothetical protein C5L39_10310 [Corynebacterium alimapuense]
MSVFSAVGLSLSLLGCSTATEEENEASACESYDALVLALSDASAAVDSSSTIGEISDARESVADAYADFNEALEEVGADRSAALEDAWDDLEGSFNSVDDEQTIPQAVETVTPAIENVQNAQEDMSEALSCGDAEA